MAGELYFYFCLLPSLIYCVPVNIGDGEAEHLDLGPVLSGISALTFLILLVFVAVGCACCQNQSFKSFFRPNAIHLPSRGGSEANFESLRANSEFTIFPPASMKTSSSVADDESEHVTFEPLPDITTRNTAPYEQALLSDRPPKSAHFKALANTGLSLQDWFVSGNFPRNRLQYLQELGSGWYGQAVEGEAQQISADQRTTKVVVKILREDATPSEHVYFLHEVRYFKDLRHPNILQLLGQCLETDPFLILLEHCPVNLKSFLISQRSSSDELLQDGLLLDLACQLTSGLQCMHSSGFVHNDLSARNCLLDLEGRLKIGDYGTSYSTFPEDYYSQGDVAFPLRWCAPETVLCVENAVEAKEVTREANMWSFGITLWEMIELGKQPYMELNDHQVLHEVIELQNVKMEEPKSPCLHRTLLFQVMQFCWGPPETRPSINKVQALLNHLQQNKELSPSQAFEERWHALQQQQASAPEPTPHNLRLLTSSESPLLSFENHFNPKSESMRNLRGSLEDIVRSPEQQDEEVKVERQISLAIQELDDYLAGEVTSSEISSDTATPEPNECLEMNLQICSEKENDGIGTIFTSTTVSGDTNFNNFSEREEVASPKSSPRNLELNSQDLEYVL